MSAAGRLRPGPRRRTSAEPRSGGPATRRRTPIALLAAAMIAVLAGCTADRPDPIPAPIAGPGSAPPPAGITAPDESCQPRKSLRPKGTLPAPGKMPAGTHMAEIQKRGRLILGTSQDTLLFSSRNPFTGKVEGFDVDMGRQIAEAIFGDPDKIQIKVIGYDQRVDLAADGTVDLVADTMTMNCERWQDVNFSTVYYDAGQKVLVASDSPMRGPSQPAPTGSIGQLATRKARCRLPSTAT